MLRQLDWTLNLQILNFIHVHYSILCFPQKVTNTFQPLFFFKSRLMLIPSIKSLWPCCFLKAFKLTYVHLLSCLFSQLPPLYSPFLSPSSSSHTHTDTHTRTQTLAFWFEAPFCLSQRPHFALVSVCMLALLPCLRPPSWGPRYFVARR